LSCVREGREAVERALDALDSSLDHELIAVDVREAMDALGALVGHVSAEDLLNRIFSEFCVGK
jgi:tRNA modification GTPase